MTAGANSRASTREAAERIHSKRDKIVEDWSARVREEIPASRLLNRTALIDSLPVVLGEISDVLADTSSQPESTYRIEVLGNVHGLARAFVEAYDVEHVQAEYEILQQVLLAVLEAGSPLDAGPRDMLLGMVQAGQHNAVKEFLRRREEERNRVEVKAERLAGEVGTRERMFNAILGATNDHVFVLNPDGRLIYVNRAAAEVHDRPRNELLGLGVREFWASSASVDQFEENFHRACRGEQVIQEHRFPTPSGERQFEYALSPVFDEQGKIEFVVSITRDVEERRRAEIERDRFFQLSPDLFCIAGTDGYLKRVNPAFTETLGWTEEELLSRPFLEFVHPDDVAATLAKLEECRNGHWAVRFENRYRRRDGTYRSLSWSTTALSELQLMYAAARDVTEMKATQADAEQRAQFEQQLIGIVSHDLRNPISAIVLGTQALLRREELDEKTLRAVQRIHGSAERTSRMVRDLLDFTQARLGGGIPVQCRLVDLHALVRQTLMEVEAAHPGRRIIHRTVGSGSGEWDPDRIAQMVTNLVANALKYSPEETSVIIETKGSDERMVLAIQNAGAPIAPDRLSRLFEPLQRATAQVDVVGRSVGLGLYIVKQIVDAHRGTINVHSTDADGTTFTVELPRHACPPR